MSSPCMRNNTRRSIVFSSDRMRVSLAASTCPLTAARLAIERLGEAFTTVGVSFAAVGRGRAQ